MGNLFFDALTTSSHLPIFLVLLFQSNEAPVFTEAFFFVSKHPSSEHLLVSRCTAALNIFERERPHGSLPSILKPLHLI